MGLAVAVIDKDASYREHPRVLELSQLGFEAEGFAGEASVQRSEAGATLEVSAKKFAQSEQGTNRERSG
jgi:hypothetical protein